MKTVIVFAGLSWLGVCNLLVAQSSDTGDLTPVVTATLAGNEILEACPFVITTTIANPGQTAIDASLDLTSPGAIVEAISLVLESPDGQTRRLNYTGKPHDNIYSLPVRRPMAPGMVVEVDRVFAPLAWGREGEVRRYGYRFVPPGEYSATIHVAYGPGQSVASSPFDVQVVPANGEDSAARDKVTVEIAAFLCGGEPPSRAHGSARVSLDEILNDHAASRYAEWIRFWKFCHDASEEETLQYARTHADFPLSDNLMLRAIRRVSRDDERSQEAIQLIDELSQLFPDGDARGPAMDLKQKLNNKR